MHSKTAFNEEKEKLAKELKAAVVNSIICITVDMWGDKIRHLNYLGAVMHYLLRNENGKHTLCTKAMALKVMDAEDEKSAENVHQMVLSVLVEYDLYVDIDKIVFLSDRGPDIKAALGCYNRNFCFSHLLNNTVQHASEPAINKLTTNVSKVVKYMKVRGLNNKLSTCLISYVSTRWNTRFDMFDSFIKVHSQIGPLIKQAKTKHVFDLIDISELKEIAEYLKIYKLLTNETEGDKYVNCVKILPCVETLRKHNIIQYNDHPTVKKMKDAATNYMENNVVHHLPKDYEMWAFFHPMWKRMNAFLSVNTDEIIKKITDSIENVQIGIDPSTSKDNSSVTEQPNPESIFAQLWDSSTTRSAPSSADVEVAKYMEFPVANNSANENILDWWDMHGLLFPRLYRKFLDIAPIMACSSSVERLFSHGGNTLTAKRNRMDPETLEVLVFLNKNKDF